MTRFSERMGFRPVKDVVQIVSMDNDLRIGLWNAVLRAYFFGIEANYRVADINDSLDIALTDLWEELLKRPLTHRPANIISLRDKLADYFGTCLWHDVYDFIEFLAGHYALAYASDAFTGYCNDILEREMSGYRFVGTTIVRITSDQEIAAIEGALKVAGPLQPVRGHLQQALSLLSDRKTPDYRNSIKESISAVEALCKLIAGDPKATLGSALNAIHKAGKVELHATLKEALHKLYGYTSDADGIRHALKDAPTVDHEDAMFMLTTCSAYVSYLLEKAQKAGVVL